MPICMSAKEEIKKHIFCRNQLHFSKAKDTPWNKSPLCCIGWHNNCNVFQCNNETIELPPFTLTETSDILNILREETHETHKQWSSNVTFEEFVNGIKHWKEKTSMSPSGQHLGSAKCSLLPIKTEQVKFQPMNACPGMENQQNNRALKHCN